MKQCAKCAHVLLVAVIYSEGNSPHLRACTRHLSLSVSIANTVEVNTTGWVNLNVKMLFF